MLDIREVLRHIQAGESDRRIARDLGITRRTAGKYREWATRHGVLSGALPSAEELVRLLAEGQSARLFPTPSSVEPYRAIVVDLRARGVEVATVFRRLRNDHGYRGSYASVRRFVSTRSTIKLMRPSASSMVSSSVA